MRQRHPRQTNPAYIRFVREQPCCVCGVSPCEAHHIKGVGHFSGAGMKADDYLVMPLCPEHHREVHAGLYVDMQPIWTLQTLMTAFREGVFR